MPSKKNTTKIVPDIEMKSNPLTRKRRNRLTTRLSSKNVGKKNAIKKVKMLYNPVRDCGSIGGGKKKTRKYTKKYTREKRKSCGCNKSWFF